TADRFRCMGRGPAVNMSPASAIAPGSHPPPCIRRSGFILRWYSISSIHGTGARSAAAPITSAIREDSLTKFFRSMPTKPRRGGSAGSGDTAIRPVRSSRSPTSSTWDAFSRKAIPPDRWRRRRKSETPTTPTPSICAGRRDDRNDDKMDRDGEIPTDLQRKRPMMRMHRGDTLIGQYQPYAAGYDEMCTPAGEVRPHWQYLARVLAGLSPGELDHRRSEANRLLRENGVTYNVYTDPAGGQR